MKQHVEELESLFGGRSGLTEALGVGSSAVSNWSVYGVPDHQKHRIICELVQIGHTVPPWLYEPTPKRGRSSCGQSGAAA